MPNNQLIHSLCVHSKDKSNPAAHHSFIHHTLSIISRQAENTLRYAKDNILAAGCHRKAWRLVTGKLYQQTAWSTRACLRILSLYRLAGCYMLGEENRQLYCFHVVGVLERLYLWMCVCVWRFNGRACTDRSTGHPVASGDHRPWFTT